MNLHTNYALESGKTRFTRSPVSRLQLQLVSQSVSNWVRQGVRQSDRRHILLLLILVAAAYLELPSSFDRECD